jgi:hypothetical protein
MTMVKTHVDASPSSSSIWINCAASVTKARGRSRVPTVYTREGTAAHMLAEMLLRTHKRKAAISSVEVEGETIPVTEEMMDAVWTYVRYVRDRARQGKLHIETKVRIASDGEPLSGTTDAFVVNHLTRELEVIDFKFGQGVAVSPDSSQLRIYALGAMEFLGPFVEINNVLLTIVQPRINPNPLTITFTVKELADWENGILLPALARLTAGDTTETPGGHCRWCVRAGECVSLANQAMAVAKVVFDEVVTDNTSGMPPDPAGLTDTELGQVLDQAELISTWVTKVRAEASARIDNGSMIPGWKLVPKRASRKWVDTLSVVRELVQRGVDVMDIVRVETIGHVEAVMKRHRIAKDVINPFTVKESTGTTLVSDKDPRKSVDTSAKSVFSDSIFLDSIEEWQGPN